MPIVDIEKVEKEAKEKKEAIPEIVTKSVGDKTYFKGKQLDDWFDSYGECLKANEAEARKKEYAKLGLNEEGQSPEQVEIAKKTGELGKRKAKLLEKVGKIDAEIAEVKRGVKAKTAEAEAPKKKK